MADLLRESKPVARKNYHCDACEYVRESMNQGFFTFAEYRQIVKAKRQDWSIKSGQQYIKQVQVDQGDIITYRAIPEMDTLCHKYDLFPDW